MLWQYCPLLSLTHREVLVSGKMKDEFANNH